MENDQTPSESVKKRLGRSLVQPRPFEGVRWAYWLLAVFGGAALLSLLRNSIPWAFTSAVLAVMLMASLWEAHARKLMPEPSSNPALRFICTIAGLGLWSTVFTVPLLIVTPACACQDYTPRARISESILATSSVKTEISERYRTAQTLRGIGHGLSVPPGPRVASATVSEEGVIIVASNDPPAVITFTPTEDKNEGKLRWTCVGKPEKVMPASCRQ